MMNLLLNKKTISIFVIIGLIGSAYSYHLIKLNSVKDELLSVNNSLLVETSARAEIQLINARQASQISQLTVVNEDLSLQYENYVRATKNTITQQNTVIAELKKETSRITLESTHLKEVLSTHDLEYLASQKPILITNRINRATIRVFDDLTEATSNGD